MTHAQSVTCNILSKNKFETTPVIDLFYIIYCIDYIIVTLFCFDYIIFTLLALKI